MRIKSFHIENFRRLQNVRVELNKETTIFVGANNSGKTSATHVFHRFLSSAKFQIFDFSVSCWDNLRSFDPASDGIEVLPEITLDVWFEVEGDDDIHRALELLPGLDWQSGPLGVRMKYAPKENGNLIGNFEEAIARAAEQDQEADPAEEAPETGFKAWPKDMFDYLSKELTSEYEILTYVLDHRECNDDLIPLEGYEPFPTASGLQAVQNLVRVDFLHAQRYLTDPDTPGAGGRAENLTKRLSEYYRRNLEQHTPAIGTLRALDKSESELSDHYHSAFDRFRSSISKIGYPGIANPQLMIKALLDPATILASNTHVHYAIDEDGASTLPDGYAGLGFKNLLYMAVEILDCHHAWQNHGGQRPPVHLIIVEEPESHLHVQLQQVFVQNIFELVGEAEPGFTTQAIVTTHSSHVLYSQGFSCIRYFRRSLHAGADQLSDIKDLSSFATDDFLRRYLKLTHCDLFFADAAILVEGDAERLLLPLIIEKNARELESKHLTILEVSGAFAHRFDRLLKFLGITALIITDLDSVEPGTRKACITTEQGTVTSNGALKHWFPQQGTVSDLLAVPGPAKAFADPEADGARIRIAYQTECPVDWGGEHADLAGRTLEEAFALENLPWLQDPARNDLELHIDAADQLPLEELHQSIHERVRNMGKTSFALSLIEKADSGWAAPAYIVEGLTWLQDELRDTPAVTAVEAIETAESETAE